MTGFIEDFTLIFNWIWNLIATLFQFLQSDILLSSVLAIFIIRLLRGFYKRLRRIF